MKKQPGNKKPRKPTQSQGSGRRHSSRSRQKSRIDVPAALVFILGIALAVGLIWWAQKALFRPAPAQQKTAKTAPANPAGKSPAKGAAATDGQAAGTGKPASTGQPPVSVNQAGSEPQAPGQSTGKNQGPASGTPSGPSAAGPLLTIVIDDMGGSTSQAGDVLDLGLPLTLSILPNLAHTREVDALAAKAGAEVLLHQPMEAQDKAAEAAGPGVLKVGMSAAEAAQILAANLAQTPHAVGMNNHMGSRGTEDVGLMRAVMAELKARNLFFLDSRTSDRSVGDKEAPRLGVPFLARAVFLDNEHGQQAAILMLKEAERLALTRGRAIAIGHPRPETLAALSAWSIRRDTRIKLVPLARQLKAH